MMNAGCRGRRRACFPVYILSPVRLCGQQQDFADLRRALDLARVALDPGVGHRELGDPVEMLWADMDVLQAAWQAEAADQIVEQIRGVLAGLAHGFGHELLPLGVDRL